MTIRVSVHWRQFLADGLLLASVSRGLRFRSALLGFGLVLASTSAVLTTTRAAAQNSVPPVGSAGQQAEPNSTGGLITIESDTQTADNLTGVVTAVGNVRIVYPARGMVATSRQAQYFSREGRLVLSGDVDVTQKGGNALRAERVIYLLEDERAEAIPSSGQQVFSQMVIRPDRSSRTPLTP